MISDHENVSTRMPISPKKCTMLLALAVTFAIHGSQPTRLNAKVHWLANTSGRPENHVQNFIEDMSVKPDGTVLTQSFYDEAQHPDAAYKEGRSVGYNWGRDSTNPHPSRRASHGGVTWNIRNFWGRAFLGKVAPPSRDSLPYIESSDGRSIRDLVDPTALAFDLQGHLLVAENGPDQNVKIFSLATRSPRLLRTFGDSGGVFAGARRGPGR
jgi:hypothetical protein